MLNTLSHVTNAVLTRASQKHLKERQSDDLENVNENNSENNSSMYEQSPLEELLLVLLNMQNDFIQGINSITTLVMVITFACSAIVFLPFVLGIVWQAVAPPNIWPLSILYFICLWLGIILFLGLCLFISYHMQKLHQKKIERKKKESQVKHKIIVSFLNSQNITINLQK